MIYRVQYYLWFQAATGGLRMYPPKIKGVLLYVLGMRGVLEGEEYMWNLYNSLSLLLHNSGKNEITRRKKYNNLFALQSNSWCYSLWKSLTNELTINVNYYINIY